MTGLVEYYHQAKLWIGDGTGAPETILHIHGGLAVLMIARIVTRRSLGSFFAWWIVLAAELLNELLDRITYGSWRWADTFSDIGHTMFWPTVICLAVRWRPLLTRSDAEKVPVPAHEPA